MGKTSTDGTIIDSGRPQTFASLQSALDSKRRARPPPIRIDLEDVEKAPVSLRQPQIKKRESKGGLRGIFTRNKPEKLDNVLASPLTEEAPSTIGLSDRTMRDMTESSLRHSNSSKRAATTKETIITTPTTPSKPVNRPLRMNLRSKSVKQPKATNKSPKSTRSTTKSTSKSLPRTSAAWDPPPLFQAYPQAIKHAQLSASTLSADSILRTSNHKRNNSIRDEFAQVAMDEGVEQSETAKKPEKPKIKHRRQMSGSVSKAEWTQKIFVLVTSGYLLQYSGFGSFDRLPEKMLQLGKDSVAFASDVIPGKHWVLQVSQAMDLDGTPAADPRSLLSRLTFRGADYKRTATSLLLVLESAGEMDSWIAVLRREIEALGGKKHVSETGKPKPEDKVMQLQAQPSHRCLPQKDQDQLSHSNLLQAPPSGTLPWVKEEDNDLHRNSEDSISQFNRPQSSIIRPSTGYRSVTVSIASTDGRQLDNLRDSQNRLSYMSQRTLITSRSSSPMVSPSPTRDTFDEVPYKHSMDDVRPRPNAAAISERRRSMQTTYISIIHTSDENKKKHRHSTHGGPGRPFPAPNFSVPTSSNKRYSIMASQGHENKPPIPSISTSRAKDSSQKRKLVTTAMNSSRPLSPVKDSNSPRRNSRIPTKAQEIIHPSIGASPDTMNTPDSTPREPESKVGNIVQAGEAVAQLDFQFPRKFASMQVLREDSVTYLPDAPLRQPPPPPPTTEKPLPDTPKQENQAEVSIISEENTDSLPNLISTPSMLIKKKQKSARPLSFSSSSPPPPTSLSSPIPPRRQSSTTPALPINPASLPALQRVKDLDSKALGNRRSMPVLLNGPPPAPPPNCALPPLPPPNTERKPSLTPVKV